MCKHLSNLDLELKEKGIEETFRGNWNYIVVVILLTCGLMSCFSNEDELTGKKKVKGSENLFVKIYQKDKFDYVTPISFELINQDGSIIISNRFLTGTDVRHEKIERFYPCLHDGIFYLCYPYPKVYAIHPLDPAKSKLSRDTLFKILKEHDSRLIDSGG